MAMCLENTSLASTERFHWATTKVKFKKWEFIWWTFVIIAIIIVIIFIIIIDV